MFSELLSRRGLSLDRLQNFCRIAELGGITKAAQGDLGKQSLYSRQIKELEAFFGIPLKVRQGRGMALTEAGQRLARCARAQLLELAEFQRAARNLPEKMSIGAGNSVIEWMLAPHLPALGRAFPLTRFECVADRTKVLVDRLGDLTLDLGIVREDLIGRPLKSKPLARVGYALFVPKRLTPNFNGKNLRQCVSRISLATSMSGSFRAALEAKAAQHGWALDIVVSCSSFTQAARCVATGKYGGILPDIARVDFDPSRVLQLPLPFLKDYTRGYALAWNPRLVEVRPSLAKMIQALGTSLQKG